MRLVQHYNTVGNCSRPVVCGSTRAHCAPRCHISNLIEYYYDTTIRSWVRRVASIGISAIVAGYVSLASPLEVLALEDLGEAIISDIQTEYNSESISDTPYTRGQKLQYGLVDGTRIRKCEGSAQPNCISTSSTTNLYSPPFETNTKSALESIQVGLLIRFFLLRSLTSTLNKVRLFVCVFGQR